MVVHDARLDADLVTAWLATTDPTNAPPLRPKIKSTAARPGRPEPTDVDKITTVRRSTLHRTRSASWPPRICVA